jgi:hypothetical protein
MQCSPQKQRSDAIPSRDFVVQEETALPRTALHALERATRLLLRFAFGLATMF